tara:strand:- start:396 stop:557 length:162 start_codon:yes stop_codon:yes gene_type:complete
VLSKTTLELPCTKDIVELELAVCSLIKTIPPVDNDPAVVIDDILLLLYLTNAI